ncbi:MAG: hypothetical protein AAF432_13670, partial [Planctomycetota bacterium]
EELQATVGFFRRWLSFGEADIRQAETSKQLNVNGWIAYGRSMHMHYLSRRPIIELRSEGFTAFIIDTNRTDNGRRVSIQAELYDPDGWWFGRVSIFGAIEDLVEPNEERDVVSVFRKYIRIVPVGR